MTFFAPSGPFYLKNDKRYKKMLGVTFVAFFKRNPMEKNIKIGPQTKVLIVRARTLFGPLLFENGNRKVMTRLVY